MTIDMNISHSAGEVSKRPILSNAGNGELEKSLYTLSKVSNFVLNTSVYSHIERNASWQIRKKILLTTYYIQIDEK